MANWKIKLITNMLDALAPAGKSAGAVENTAKREWGVPDNFDEDFLRSIYEALDTNKNIFVNGGTLHPDAYNSIMPRLPKVHSNNGVPLPDVINNRILVGTHGPVQHVRLGETTPEMAVTNTRNLINSQNTRAIPNFPTNKPEIERSRKSDFILVNRDGSLYAIPSRIGERGDIVATTEFIPDTENEKFAMNYIANNYPELLEHYRRLGRPTSPISGQQKGHNPSASAQQPGLSAVKRRITAPYESTLGYFLQNVNKKKMIPPIVAGITADPQDAWGSVSPGNPYMQQPQNTYGRQLGLGTRAVLEGMGELPGILNELVNVGFGTKLQNPGKGLADWVGLPTPSAGTSEEMAADIQRGISGGLAGVGTGLGLARMPAQYMGRFGRWLADSPLGQATIGGILGAMGSNGKMPPFVETEDGGTWFDD